MTPLTRPHTGDARPASRLAGVLAGCALVLLTGCDGGDGGTPQSPSATPEVTAVPPSTPPSGAPSSSSSPTTSRPTLSASPLIPTPAPTSIPRATPAEPTPTPVPTDPDRSGDPVHGYRSLTGTIQAGGGCPVLLVSNQRWALTGQQVSTLRTGEDVQVRGRVVGVPRGCTADHALEVTQLRRLR